MTIHTHDDAYEPTHTASQTAHALDEERTACLEAGMVDHISKPIDPDALLALILQHINRHSSTP